MKESEILEMADKINEVYSYLADTEWNDEKQQVRNILRSVIKAQDRDTRHACDEAVNALPGRVHYVGSMERCIDKDAAHSVCMNVKAV